VSSESSCAVRLARHSQNAWARHVECVESSRVEPSGIWAYYTSGRSDM